MNVDRYERDDWAWTRHAFRTLDGEPVDWRDATPGRPIDKRPMRRMRREDRRRGIQQDPMESAWVLAALVLAAVAIFVASVMGLLP